MNQSELIEKVAQATELSQAAAGQAVKAVVNAILDGLVPAREGRNPQTGAAVQIAASKAARFHAGKAVKDALNPPTAKAASREEGCTTKEIRGAEVNVFSIARPVASGLTSS